MIVTATLVKGIIILTNRIVSWFGSGYLIHKGRKEKRRRYYVAAAVVSIVMLLALYGLLHIAKVVFTTFMKESSPA